VFVELAVAMTMEHDGAIWLMIPCDHRIMAESQHKILRQERAGGRLDSQIEDLRRSLEIVGVCPYGTVMIALYKKLLSWKLFQQITGTKKEVPLCCDTSVYSCDRSIYQLPLQ
jgi:hypothetical protein